METRKLRSRRFYRLGQQDKFYSPNFPGTPGKTVCLPVKLKSKDGVYSAQPVFGKAGMISTLTRADGFIIIDMNKEGLKKDETVLVHLF